MRGIPSLYQIAYAIWTLIPATLRQVSPIKSIQTGTLSINNGSTTGTATIAAVDTSKAFPVYGGHYNSASANDGFGMHISASTTLSGDRGAFNTGNTVVRFYIVELW
jgi:hypothetical protein